MGGVIAALLAMIAVGCAVVAGAAGPVVVQGVVIDQDGNPVVGATIEAVTEGSDTVFTVQTKKKGRFSIRVVDYGQVYNFTVSMEGYDPAGVSLQPRHEQIRPVTVTLVKSSEEAPAAAAQPDEAHPTGPTTDGEAEPEISEERIAAIASYNEGVAVLQSGDREAAMAAFKAANEIDPDFPDAYKAAAAVAMELEDYQSAADAAENLIRLSPRDEYAIATAYSAEYMINDVERLGEAARRLAEIRPEVVSNEMLTHSQVLFGSDELDASRTLLEVILERQPDLVAAHLQLGLTCNMMGDTECAKAALSTALELDPDGPNAATARSLLEYLD